MENTTTVSPYQHVIVLEKLSQRQLNEKSGTRNIDQLVESVWDRAKQVRGWAMAVKPSERTGKTFRSFDATPEQIADGWKYRNEASIVVDFVKADDKPEPHEFVAICSLFATRAVQPQFGRWALASVDGSPYRPPTEGNGEEKVEGLGYAPVRIPDDWESHFAHLYGLDGQVMRLKRALEAGIMSDWDNRENVVFIGPPGCGKSDLASSMKRALGEDAVMELDATATTAAGAIKELTERPMLPQVIIIEEIEKAEEKAMSFLLGVLDQRSQIRKVTARGSIIRDTKLFAVATVNDEDLFNKQQAGALSSRFSEPVYFQRPSREQLAKILLREIEKIDGDTAWIEPTLDYCEERGITDPRKVKSICLCGREMLLTGEWQAIMASTSKKEVRA